MKDCSQVELLRKYISEFHNRSRTYGLHKYRTDAHKYRLQRPTHIYECPIGILEVHGFDFRWGT